MPFGPEILGDGWRKVDVPGLGTVEVRRAVMRDMAQAGGNPYWWTACVRCMDGTPILPDGVAAADIDATIGNALLQEVLKDRPTHPQNAVYGG